MKIKLKKTSNESSAEDSTTDKKRKTLSILICLFGDWIVAAYLYITIVQGREYFNKIFEVALKAQGVGLEDMEANVVDSFFQKCVTVTIVMIVLFLFFHMVSYWLYFKENGFGKFYVKSLAYLGVFFFGIFALTSYDKPIFAMILFIQTALYFYIIKSHKKIQNEG